MKKRILLFVVTFLTILGIASVHTTTVSAASWGAKKIFTTPKATRGVWYVKNGGLMSKFKITAHTDNGAKLYQQLSNKEQTKWLKKLIAIDEKTNYKVGDKIEKTMCQAKIVKFHGSTGFSDGSWLTGTVGQEYYIPVKRTVKGKRVNALHLIEGDFFDGYAYHSKKLAKQSL